MITTMGSRIAQQTSASIGHSSGHSPGHLSGHSKSSKLKAMWSYSVGPVKGKSKVIPVVVEGPRSDAAAGWRTAASSPAGPLRRVEGRPAHGIATSARLTLATFGRGRRCRRAPSGGVGGGNPWSSLTPGWVLATLVGVESIESFLEESR